MASTVKFYINSGAADDPTGNTFECTASDTFKFTGSASITAPVQAPASNYIVANKLQMDATVDKECLRYEGGGTAGTYGSAPAWTLAKDDYIFIEITGTAESAAGKVTFWNTSSHASTAGEPLQDVDWNAATECWIRGEETANNVSMTTVSDNSTSAGYKAQTDAENTYQVFGASNMITFSGAVSIGNCNRMICHSFVPHNATGGTKSFVISYYNYTT